MAIPSCTPLLVGALLGVAGCTDQPQVSPTGPLQTATAAAGDTISVWLTNGDKSALLTKQPSLVFSSAGKTNPTINVDPAVAYQTMDGFGYTLTGGSAMVINRLPAGNKDALLRELFARSESSLGVSYLRLSIGASDLSAYPFTYNELPAGQTDPEVQNFRIDEERKDLLPVLKQILAINPNIQIMGTPWTAPTWMKDNKGFKGGSLLREHFPAYAKYFVKYLQAMQAEGITVHAITVQNEPLHDGNNPSMYMTAADQAEFVKNHLGPALRSAGLSTKIILYDHNADHPEYPISILNDPAANAFVDGSAFHLYGGSIDALTQVHNAHPDRSLYFTEQYTASSGSFAGDLRWHIRNIITGAPNNWAKVVLEWNLANNETYGPHTEGGCSNCLGAVTIHSSTGGVTRNVAFYIVGHASRFVGPGSVRIGSSVSNATKTSKLVHVAFKTTAGKHVLIAMNDGNRAQTFNIGFAGRIATHTLNVGAVATYVW